MTPATAEANVSFTLSEASSRAIAALVAAHGEQHRAAIEQGVARVASRWSAKDGDSTAFEAFCTKHFVTDTAERTRLLARLEKALEQIDGHLYEMRRTLRRHHDLRGDEFPGVDDILAQFDPAPDLSEQLYKQKIAHLALLNFERPTLATMLEKGTAWTDADWAAARVAHNFGPRIPVELADRARKTSFESGKFVADFHVPVGGLVDANGKRWFEADRKLIAHWLVREEIKAGYGDPDGVFKQRALSWVMARHIDGSIPKRVMSGEEKRDWNPEKNTVSGGDPGELLGLERYEHWIANFRMAREFDPLYPDEPTAIARKFALEREMPEAEVEKLMTDLLDAPVRRELAAFMSKKLGRALEPFDIYFDDVVEAKPATEMNAAVKARFTDIKDFERKLPAVLRELGFDAKDADFLGSHVRAEVCKGAGHAMRPYLEGYGAWLRTSSLENELGWDGFDTAMHELGHNLEQLCSTYFVSRPALRGVPNTACTEAFAFLYQSLAKRVLGLEDAAAANRQFAVDSVATMLSACQIAGPSLLELRAWRWLYANPTATPAALRAEVLRIAEDLWKRFYERDFGQDPYRILAAYQHMIAHPLYLPDYTLGHMMSHQIRSYMRGKDLAGETKRITSLGCLTPDLWMRRAVGGPVSAAPLAADASAGLALLG
ncbi:MAG: hypothetical protein RL591_2129 [Planctomycetota bacterium]|jgi:hypothetical protein